MYERETKILCDAIKEFGEHAQLQMVIEECAELIKAVCKYLRNPVEDNKIYILEEIADVLIMIQQVQIMYGFEMVNDFRREKILRLESRIYAHQQRGSGNNE